jgi:hypothetical protein
LKFGPANFPIVGHFSRTSIEPPEASFGFQ